MSLPIRRMGKDVKGNPDELFLKCFSSPSQAGGKWENKKKKEKVGERKMEKGYTSSEKKKKKKLTWKKKISRKKKELIEIYSF